MTVKLNGVPLANKFYEIQKNGQKVGENITNELGQLVLKDGESAYIEDAGLLKDTFEVTEKPNDGDGSGIIFGQVYPPEGKPSKGTLLGEGGIARFFNGSGKLLW